MKNRIRRISVRRIVPMTWSIWALLIVGCAPVSLEENSKYRVLTDEEAQQYEQLQVYIEFENDEYQQDESPWVRITYTNASEYPMRVHTELLPSADFWENSFLVMLDGEAVRYIGRQIRRAPPTDSDFIYLEPGESIDGVIDLSRLYDFSRTGQYRIQFVADPEMIGYHSSPEEFQVVSNWAAVHVEGRTTTRSEPRMLRVVNGIAYNQCSSSQQADLEEALRWAQRYAASARRHLRRNSSGDSDIYRTWFGRYTSDYFEEALTTIAEMKSAIKRETVTFHCDCNRGFYAWVYPDEEYDIHVCRAFWKAPMTGNYSKADTIVHEMSHFISVGNTDDYKYGMRPCQRLANKHPDRAVDNADNFAFFSVQSDD